MSKNTSGPGVTRARRERKPPTPSPTSEELAEGLRRRSLELLGGEFGAALLAFDQNCRKLLGRPSQLLWGDGLPRAGEDNCYPGAYFLPDVTALGTGPLTWQERGAQLHALGVWTVYSQNAKFQRLSLEVLHYESSYTYRLRYTQAQVTEAFRELLLLLDGGKPLMRIFTGGRVETVFTSCREEAYARAGQYGGCIEAEIPVDAAIFEEWQAAHRPPAPLWEQARALLAAGETPKAVAATLDLVAEEVAGWPQEEAAVAKAFSRLTEPTFRDPGALLRRAYATENYETLKPESVGASSKRQPLGSLRKSTDTFRLAAAPGVEPTVFDVNNSKVLPPALKVAIAAALARAVEHYPVPEGETLETWQAPCRRRDDGGTLAIHNIVSQTWRSVGNAQVRRQRLYAGFAPRLEAHVEQGGGVFIRDVGLVRDWVGGDPAKKELDRLRAQARRRGGWLVWFAVPAQERIVVLSSVQVDGSERCVAPLALLLEILAVTEPPKQRYGYKEWGQAYGPSSVFSCALPETTTNEWQYLGRRQADQVVQDEYDKTEAIARGLATWVADATEVAARAPDRIVGTRHVVVPKTVSDPDNRAYVALDYLVAVGFRLLPVVWAEYLDLARTHRKRRAA